MLLSVKIHHNTMSDYKLFSSSLVAPGILYTTGFDNYHKIAVRDHVHMPKFWCMYCTSASTKKHISDIKPFP